MTDYTNEEMDNTTTDYADEDSLFDDEDLTEYQGDSEFEEETANPQRDESDDQQKETKEEMPEDKPILAVKYDGVEKQLTEAEARELAQKGMNYDRIKQRYDELANSEELTLLDQLAKEAGVSNRTEFVKTLAQYSQHNAVNQYVEQLKQQHPDTDEAVLRELAETKLKQQKELDEQQRLNTQQQAEKAQKEAFAAQYNAFVTEYPNVDPAKLPDEVIQSMAAGETMLSAYRGYELKRLRAEKAAAEANQKNKNKSLGSVKDGNLGDEKPDPILEGFLSD
nr:MAG TPA: hypothetical protein [Caudoviricetes sp.]